MSYLVMSQCIYVSINIGISTITGMRRVSLILASRSSYLCSIAMSCCRLFNVCCVVASITCLVCIPTDLGTSGCLSLMSYLVMSQCINSYFGSADLCITYSTVNYVFVRAIVFTISCNVLFNNDITGCVSRKLKIYLGSAKLIITYRTIYYVVIMSCYCTRRLYTVFRYRIIGLVSKCFSLGSSTDLTGLGCLAGCVYPCMSKCITLGSSTIYTDLSIGTGCIYPIMLGNICFGTDVTIVISVADLIAAAGNSYTVSYGITIMVIICIYTYA